MKLTTLAAAAVLALSGAAHAQDWPTSQVTLIIPFTAGGSTDTLGRFLANELQEKWGQPVVVENVPGASGTIGAARLSVADPDGHTQMITTSAYATAPAALPSLPYDPLTDIAAVALPGYVPNMIIAGDRLKANTLEEFIAEAREREVLVGLSGPGATNHFAGEMFASQADFPLNIVHYSGIGEAIVDMMGGRLDVFLASMTGLAPYVHNGQARAIGVMSPERVAAFPDVQVPSELGIEGAESVTWFGYFTTGGTPDDVVTKINADVNAVMASPAGVALLESLATMGGDLSVEEFTEMVSTELVQWKTLAEERNLF